MPRIGTSLLAATLAALAVGGCTLVNSEDIKTSGIWAYFALDHHADDRAVAWSVLRVGGALGTIVTMSGGEHLDCNDTRLREYVEPITSYHWYRAEVSPTFAGYDFEFVRSDETVLTHLESAAPPVILGTTPVTEVGPGEALTVTWDDSLPGDHVTASVSGSCIELRADSGLSDDGSHTFEPLAPYDPLHPESCELTVTVTRVIDGAVNPAYDSGHTESRREDSVGISFRAN